LQTDTTSPNGLTIVRLFVLAAGVHAMMLLYDNFHPDVFLHADRAVTRWKDISGLLSAFNVGESWRFLATHGVLGDYAFHAAFVYVGGRSFTQLLQVLLILIGSLAVYRLGRLCALDERSAVIGAAVFLLFPHTIVLPHQLTTEGLFTPLLILATWAIAEGVRPSHKSLHLLRLGGFMLGIATLVRPITLLWPLIVTYYLLRDGKAPRAMHFVASAYLPIVVWSLFIFFSTNDWGLGESNHSLSRNLYMRAEKVVMTMPQISADRARAKYLVQGEKGSLAPLKYFQFAMENPLPLMRQFSRDSAVFFSKSGIERVAIDYFNAPVAAKDRLQNYDTGWRRRWDRDGAISALKYLWTTTGPALLLMSIAGAVAMLTVSGLAFIGAGNFLTSTNTLTESSRLARMMICCLPVYTLLFSQVVPAVSSRHRAPSEFAFAILSVVGWLTLRQFIGTRRLLRLSAWPDR